MRLLITTQVVDRTHSNLGFFHGWIEEFARQCETVHVICLQEGEHTLPSNVFVHSLGKEHGAGRIERVMRFYRYIREFRSDYDSVFVHMNPEYVVLGGVSWRLWQKNIALWYMHKSVTWWLRIATLFADVIFTASAESFRLKSSKLRILGHGIDTSHIAPRLRDSEETLRIVALGRISERKCQLEMLDVLDELERRNKKFTLTIAGAPLTSADIAYESKLKTAIARKLYANSIHLIGAVPHAEILPLLSRFDAMLHMSETGSLDKVVLEALAAGTPVISTSEAFVGDIPGVVHVRNNPSEIADKLMHSSEIDPATLQTYVRENHGLPKLIATIVSALAPAASSH